MKKITIFTALVGLLFTLVSSNVQASDCGIQDAQNCIMADIAPCNLDNTWGDQVVDIADLIELMNHWGTVPSAPGGNINCDVNRDGVIGQLDLITIINNFGTVCSEYATVSLNTNSIGFNMDDYNGSMPNSHIIPTVIFVSLPADTIPNSAIRGQCGNIVPAPELNLSSSNYMRFVLNKLAPADGDAARVQPGSTATFTIKLWDNIDYNSISVVGEYPDTSIPGFPGDPPAPYSVLISALPGPTSDTVLVTIDLYAVFNWTIRAGLFRSVWIGWDFGAPPA